MTWSVPLAVGVLVTVLVIVLLAPRRRAPPPSTTRIVRRRVTCPAHGEEATVELLVDADGGEVYTDVLSCSLLGDEVAEECGRVCRSTSVAPFDPRRERRPAAFGGPADPAGPALWCIGPQCSGP